MRLAGSFFGVLTLVAWSGVVARLSSRALAPGATPLILEKGDGERRWWRPVEGLTGQPSLFILKVDPHNGGSAHLVFGTEDLPPGGRIEPHRHPASDEILFLQNGLARVTLANTVKDVHGGATVFVPAGTWVSVVNRGTVALQLAFVFSAPGFEEFMRAESARDGEKIVPLSKAEDAAILAQHAHVVVYQSP